MNDGMNDVLATRERSMGLYAWHECVHDEEEAGEEHRLGDITGWGVTVGFVVWPLFFSSPEWEDLACCWVWDGLPTT